MATALRQAVEVNQSRNELWTYIVQPQEFLKQIWSQTESHKHVLNIHNNYVQHTCHKFPFFISEWLLIIFTLSSFSSSPLLDLYSHYFISPIITLKLKQQIVMFAYFYVHFEFWFYATCMATIKSSCLWKKPGDRLCPFRGTRQWGWVPCLRAQLQWHQDLNKGPHGLESMD